MTHLVAGQGAEIERAKLVVRVGRLRIAPVDDADEPIALHEKMVLSEVSMGQCFFGLAVRAEIVFDLFNEL